MIRLPWTLVLVVNHAVLVQIITFAMQPTLPYAVLDPVLRRRFWESSRQLLPSRGCFWPCRPATHSTGLGNDSCLSADRSPSSVRPSSPSSLARPSSCSSWPLHCSAWATSSLIGQQAMVANTTRRTVRFGLRMYTFGASLGQTLGPLLLILPVALRRPPLQLIFLVCGD